MTSLPIALSVTPPSTHANPAHITVTDIGSAPVRVDVSTLVLHSHCAMTTTGAVSVPVRTFTLTPGQARHITVHVPASQADYGVLFAAHPLHPVPGNQKVGAVGSQVLTGHAANCVHPKALPVPVSHSLITPTGVLILAVIVLGLALGVWGWTLHRRAVRRHAGA